MPDPALITRPGIYHHLREADYFADPCPEPSLTQSLCKVLLDRSPAHARLAHPRLAPPTEAVDEPAEKYVAAQAIGNAVHKLMLSRGRDLAVCDFDAWRSDKAKTARSVAEEAGHIPILAKHHKRAAAMADAAFRQLAAAGFPDAFGTPGEVVLAWQEDGLWCRSLVDWLELRVVWDFKTTGLSVAPHSIPKLMADADWPLQAAMIERGLNALDPLDDGRRAFRFVAQENYEPFAITICELPEAVLDMGRKKRAMAFDIWRDCMQRDAWPAYPLDVLHPQLPGWTESQWLDREIVHEAKRRQPAVAKDHLMAG